MTAKENTGGPPPETNAELREFMSRFIQKQDLLSDGGRFLCRSKDCWPCLHDASDTTPFDAHYLYHTAWAARLLAASMPEKHVDIASCLRFSSLVSAFLPVTFYDYRPARIKLSNLSSGHADVTSLPFDDNSIPSLSCMHVVEHIGLERYGDPFDPQGDLKAMAELQRVLAPGGRLLFAVPVGGTALIQYNAHRIYTVQQIIQAFSSLRLISFSLVTDSGNYLENCSLDRSAQQKYGCGCFELLKPKKSAVSCEQHKNR